MRIYCKTNQPARAQNDEVCYDVFKRRNLVSLTSSLLLSSIFPKLEVQAQPLQTSSVNEPVFDSAALMKDVANHPALPNSFPPLPDLRSLPYQQFRLNNGIKVFLVEDHELPLVAGTILFPGGWYAVPQDKLGLARVSCGVQRAGGSVSFPGDVLSDELEKIGGSIESGASPFALVSSFQCLAGDEVKVMRLLKSVITEPCLPQQQIDLWKNRVRTNIQHRNDQVLGVARRELQRLLYGKDSLYARLSTLETVDSVQRQDLETFLQEQQVPQGAVLGIVGDFDSTEIAQLLEEYFGDNFGQYNSDKYNSSNSKLSIPSSQIPAYTTGGQVFVIDFPGSKTSNVAMGQFGVDLFHPDVYSLDVLSTMLNSFGGKLFNQVRSEKGLAYSIGGGWDTPPDHIGLFQVVGDTNDVGKFITSVKTVLDEVMQVPPDPIMLEKAKNKSANTFVFNFASSRQQLQRLMVYDILGLPEDYLFQYQKGLTGVTQEDILQSARLHLRSNDLTFVIAGALDVVQPQLQQNGLEVQVLKI